ncbi:MAG TPA: aspartyl-phosphate phosphatase Spo0E family protein [Firmicutes bacterium]|nr:aspartyl-phosphate phosphatase Spo0E family protein [Bacillota bacterium]
MNKIELKTELYHEIEILREQMHHSTAPDKINNQETHRISQKLDKLILKVMRCILD